MDPFEDLVDVGVPTSTILPTFDNADVVAIYGEVAVYRFLVREEESKTFEADSFSPCDVSFASSKGLPSWGESPCPPSSIHNDADSESRTRIGVGPDIMQLNGSRDCCADKRLVKDRAPPFEVGWCSFGSGVRNERTTKSCAKHGFKVSEVCTSSGYDRTGVKELAIQFLYVFKGVFWSVKPVLYCNEILLLFGWGERDCGSCEVPVKANICGGETKSSVLGAFPWYAERVRNGIDVVKVVGI